MHFVVIVRYMYFFASFCFHVALAIVAGIVLHDQVPVTGGAVTFFLALVGALTLLGFLGFDLKRSRSDNGYHSFVFKIWFELSMMALLMFVHLVDFFFVFSLNKEHPCVHDNARVSHSKPCATLQLLWAFQVIVTVTVSFYAAFLLLASAMHYKETSRIFSTSVRDFPWGVRNAGSWRPDVLDRHKPIPFPKSTLPTFDQAFSDTHQRMEEGSRYPPHGNQR